MALASVLTEALEASTMLKSCLRGAVLVDTDHGIGLQWHLANSPMRRWRPYASGLVLPRETLTSDGEPLGEVLAALLITNPAGHRCPRGDLELLFVIDEVCWLSIIPAQVITQVGEIDAAIRVLQSLTGDV